MLRLVMIPALCLLTLFAHGLSYAQSYPRRAIQLFVPYEITSNAANQIASIMQQSMRASSGIELKLVTPKALGQREIADALSASAASNGYHLIFAHARSHLIAPLRSKSAAASPAPLLGVFATTPMTCVVRSGLGVNTMPDLLAMAKRDQKFRVSSAGKQSHSYLTAQVTLRAAGLREQFGHLALKSPAAALAALLKGTASYACIPLSVAMQLIKSRRIRALISTSPIAGLDVPTAGSPGNAGLAVLDEFAAIAGVKRLKAEAVEPWQGWLTRLSKDQRFIEQARQLGFRAGPDQLMLRAQANAVLARKRHELVKLLARYQIDVNRR